MKFIRVRDSLIYNLYIYYIIYIHTYTYIHTYKLSKRVQLESTLLLQSGAIESQRIISLNDNGRPLGPSRSLELLVAAGTDGYNT